MVGGLRIKNLWPSGTKIILFLTAALYLAIFVLIGETFFSLPSNQIVTLLKDINTEKLQLRGKGLGQVLLVRGVAYVITIKGCYPRQGFFITLLIATLDRNIKHFI